MAEDSNVLRIVKEDILRILGEVKASMSLESIRLDVNVSDIFISNALKELEKEHLIRFNDNLVSLTKQGEANARDIVKKHLVIEDYFKKTKNERDAHEAAHIFEHYISTEAIDTIKKLSTSRKKGIPLTEFKQEEGLIVDINHNVGLFERMISMGICLGERVRIVGNIPNVVLIKVRNKKIALERSIAEKIKVIEYGKS